MKTLLQIHSSILSSAGESSQLTEKFVAQWREHNPDVQITLRNVAADPIPHLDAERIGAFFTAPEMRTARQQEIAAQSDALIEEIKQAQIIALGLPMYNFGIPSTLKSYFDHIARAGITFKYTEKGAEGLLKGKKVYIFATRGGMCAGTPLDTQTDYVRNFFAFIGITDVEFIYAEGLNMGEESKKSALEKAVIKLTNLAKIA
ncbi:MAG: NAD(P)H-dependent oxidoreductase [Methylococcaceae bacterium]